MAIAGFLKHRGGGQRKIIFVNRFYWPDESATSQILTDLAEHLTSRGIDVVVVTSRLCYKQEDAPFSASSVRGAVKIHRVWTTRFHRSSIVGRMIDFLTFYLFATIALLRLVSAGDTLVAKTDPPLILVFAWLVCQVKRARLINWCQDLFPEVAYALRIPWATGPIGASLHQLRNFALRRADMNVTISTEMKDVLAIEGIDQRRIQVIENWCDRDIKPISRDTNELRKSWQLQDQFVVGYSGNLGRVHLAERVYTLVRKLADLPDLKVVFVGSGHGMRWLRQTCLDEGYEHVIFKPYQPRNRLNASLSVADLHLISLHKGCQCFVSPSKFYGVLAAGRPIAFLGDPHAKIAREIEASQFGITLASEQENDWRDQIASLQQDRTRLKAMGSRARQAYEARFQAEFSLGAWEQLIRRGEETIEATTVRRAA